MGVILNKDYLYKKIMHFFHEQYGKNRKISFSKLIANTFIENINNSDTIGLINTKSKDQACKNHIKDLRKVRGNYGARRALACKKMHQLHSSVKQIT